jgi:hypothetical protein
MFTSPCLEIVCGVEWRRWVDLVRSMPHASAVIRIGAVELAEPQPPMFCLRDPDGNSLLIVEPD